MSKEQLNKSEVKKGEIKEDTWWKKTTRIGQDYSEYLALLQLGITVYAGFVASNHEQFSVWNISALHLLIAVGLIGLIQIYLNRGSKEIRKELERCQLLNEYMHNNMRERFEKFIQDINIVLGDQDRLTIWVYDVENRDSISFKKLARHSKTPQLKIFGRKTINDMGFIRLAMEASQNTKRAEFPDYEKFPEEYLLKQEEYGVSREFALGIRFKARIYESVKLRTSNDNIVGILLGESKNEKKRFSLNSKKYRDSLCKLSDEIQATEIPLRDTSMKEKF